jgi:hypothetical protein
MEQQKEVGAAQRPQPTPNVIILYAAGHTYQGQNGPVRRYAITDVNGEALYFGTASKQFEEQRKAKYEKMPGGLKAGTEWRFGDSLAAALLDAGKKAMWLSKEVSKSIAVKPETVTVYLGYSGMDDAVKSQEGITKKDIINGIVADARNKGVQVALLEVAPEQNLALEIAQGRGYKSADVQANLDNLRGIVGRREDVNRSGRLTDLYDASRAFKAAQAEQDPALQAALQEQQQADRLLSSQEKPAQELELEAEEEEQAQVAGMGMG